MPIYENLSAALTARMEADKAAGVKNPAAFPDSGAVRRRESRSSEIWRPAFSRDIDRIMHCPYYNRYNDKTQVFSLLKNDDVCRRGLHVQLVSRIARTIGAALGLNLDLIEAIALGHDLGHAPFGHAGEHYLDKIYFGHTGRHFCHNLQSVRVLDQIFPMNLTLQTLDGIACHNGEVEKPLYQPVPLDSFEQFDEQIERSYLDKVYGVKLMPATLEGALMRVCDIVAYLGKDRQDAARINVVPESAFSQTAIGTLNAEIIHNLEVNIIENSYGQPYIKLDDQHFEGLRQAKKENYQLIYESASTRARLDVTARPMMEKIYEQLLGDLKAGKKDSPVFTHHIDYVNQSHYPRTAPYEETEPNQLVVDYIASMTDDYFIDLYQYLFPHDRYDVRYKGYFE